MCPTGDPDMPDDVRQAKSIKNMIGDKANLIGASAQFDLQSGRYGAGAVADISNIEPTQQQQLLLGQPTQDELTQTQEQDERTQDETQELVPPAAPNTNTNTVLNTNMNTVPNTATPRITNTTFPPPRPNNTTAAVAAPRHPIVSGTPSPAFKRKWNRHSSSTNSDFLETYQASLLEAREERIAAREEREEERRAAREERNEDRKEAREFFMQAMSTIAVMMNPHRSSPPRQRRSPSPSSSPPPRKRRGRRTTSSSGEEEEDNLEY